MNKKENSQTAYQHNAYSPSVVEEVIDHGWADAINTMIDQRYAFLDLEYENNGYLFRGMSSGLFDSLLENKFWHYVSEDRGAHFEKELDVLLLSQDFSDALTVSKLWQQKLDACIIVFKSEVFNSALKDKKAAMMATAEPGVVFKYPFLTTPLTLDNIDFLIIPTELLGFIQNDKRLSLFNNMEEFNVTKLKMLMKELHAAGKLLIPSAKENNTDRSVFEKLLVTNLSEQGVIAAKAIKSPFKPSRKV